MSSIPRQLLSFLAVLAVLYAGGFVAGQLIGADARGEHGMEFADHEGAGSATPHTEHAPAAAPDAVRGLAVAEDGLRIVVEDADLPAGRTAQLRFRVVGSDGEAVRDFDVEHTKRMHAIVVRHDLTGFQHLHPQMEPDGTWSTALRLNDAGSYRVFADFSHRDEPRTLATDLRVDGDAELRELPAARSTATSDGGYDVRLDAPHSSAGEESELRFTITRDGRPVDVEPYLGAGGHLVALREGDLAFMHVHSVGDGTEFAATFPTPGRHRLFLQFQHEGEVQTVAFTHEVVQ
jgi:hypothetical protein